MASKEANKLRYQYNKKYVDAYWERKAKMLAEDEQAKRLTKRVTKEKTVEEYFITEPDPSQFRTPISRDKSMTDENWIKYLETCCKSLNSENKRLIKLLSKYQFVIDLGLKGLKHELNMED